MHQKAGSIGHSRENIRVQRWVLGLGIMLFIIKLIAWYLTNSVAILTDALEGVINVLSAFLGLYSLWLAAKPRDDNHPYGHGKVEFLSAAIEGTMITIAGILIIWESVSRLFQPQEITQLEIGIVLITIAGGLNGLLGWIAIKIGTRNHSMALESSGRHLISDTLSTAGLLVGLFFVLLLKVWWLDAVVAIVFGLIIIWTGYRILRRSVAGIMDEADRELLDDLVKFLQEHRQKNWVDIHQLRIIKYGSVLHIDCHLTVPWYFNVLEAHQEVTALEETIDSLFGNRVELSVHTDGCRPSACPICTKSDCSRRQAPFDEALVWSLDIALSHLRHTQKKK